jgi:hypothetical protein
MLCGFKNIINISYDIIIKKRVLKLPMAGKIFKRERHSTKVKPYPEITNKVEEY